MTPPRMMFLAISTPRPRRPDTRTLDVCSRFIASWPNTYLPGEGGASRVGAWPSGPHPLRAPLHAPPHRSIRLRPHLQLPGVKTLIYVCFIAVLCHSLGTEGRNRIKDTGRSGVWTVIQSISPPPNHHHHHHQHPACQLQEEDTHVGWHRGHFRQHRVGRGTVRTRLWIRPGHATFLGQRRAGHLRGKGGSGGPDEHVFLLIGGGWGGREASRASISRFQEETGPER